jgi:uncharacterized membrane protein
MVSASGAKWSLAFCTAVFAVCVFAVSWWHWWTYAYSTFDLAFYVQSLWLALRGEWFVSLLNVPMLGNHAEPIVFLALPFFAVWPHPMLLIILQTAAIATMPWTAWRIARRLALSPASALLLSIAIVATPATGFVALHEFHPEAFAAPLILLLIEARIARRLGAFWCWALALIACKENLALFMAAWAIIHLVLDRRRGLQWQILWNVSPLLVAGGWLVFYVGFLSPALNQGNVDYLELYSHLGRSRAEIVRNLFEHPRIAFDAVWNAVRKGDLLW